MINGFGLLKYKIQNIFLYLKLYRQMLKGCCIVCIKDEHYNHLNRNRYITELPVLHFYENRSQF